MDAEYFRRSNILYDLYGNEFKARARKFCDGLIKLASDPVDMKYCVELDVLKSTIEMGIIANKRKYDTLNDNALRQYLENEAADSRSTRTLSGLDAIVRKDLNMDIKNKDARSRMKSLLIEYLTLLRIHGLY